MVELGYRYYKLREGIHEYSVVSLEEGTDWNQWLWHWLKFKHTKNARLLPYHSDWDNQVEILARYRGSNARIVAGHISKKIEKHKKRLRR